MIGDLEDKDVLKYSTEEFIDVIEMSKFPVVVLGDGYELYLMNSVSIGIFGRTHLHGGRVNFPKLLLSEWGSIDDDNSFCSLIENSRRVKLRKFAARNINFVTMSGRLCGCIGVASKMTAGGKVCFLVQLIMDKEIDESVDELHEYVESVPGLLDLHSSIVVNGDFSSSGLKISFKNHKTRSHKSSVDDFSLQGMLGSKKLGEGVKPKKSGGKPLERALTSPSMRKAKPPKMRKYHKDVRKHDPSGIHQSSQPDLMNPIFRSTSQEIVAPQELEEKLDELRVCLSKALVDGKMPADKCSEVDLLINTLNEATQNVFNSNNELIQAVSVRTEEIKKNSKDKLKTFESHLQRRLASIEAERESMSKLSVENKRLRRNLVEFRNAYLMKIEDMDRRRIETNV